MSLGPKQWLAVGAILIGLATFPTVLASRNSSLTTEDPNEIKRIAQSGTIVLTNVHDRKTTTYSSQPNQTVNNTYNHKDGLRQQDLPRNDWPTNDNMGRLINQQAQGNNQGFNQPYSQSGAAVADCQYSKDAIKAGVKHYRFTEANPSELVSIGGRHQLTQEAADALRQLQSAARQDGVNLSVGSAFRSVSYQQGIVNRKRAAGQSEAQIFKVSSAPGYSEHHTGYVVDFEPINHSFGKTKAYAWLRQNAARYGWEQSFTPESTRNTRITVEEWHWKYKGSPSAKAALANDVCYFRP